MMIRGAKLYRRISGDLTHQYNVRELMKNVTSLEPTSWVKTYDFFNSGLELTTAIGLGNLTGNDEWKYNADGETIRGLSAFKRNNPVTAWWQRHIYFWENAGEGEFFGKGF
jgi:hypothetical protein